MTILFMEQERRRNIESRLPDDDDRRLNSKLLIIFFFMILIAVIGGGTVARMRYRFVKSHLPAIRITRIDFGEIDVVATSNDAVMKVTINLAVFLEASNRDHEMGLVYSHMDAYVAASSVQFRAGVWPPDMRQPPKNSTTLVVAAVKDVVMDDRSARDLRSRAEAHVLTIDVSLVGRIYMIMGGKRRDACPFRVDCRSISQSTIDAGTAPNCSIALTLV